MSALPQLPPYTVEAITPAHIASFSEAIDRVARERHYLAFLEAPPLAETERFVRDNIAQLNPQFVVVSEGRVVGWCDVVRNLSRPVYAHCGMLGIGLLPEFRHRGLGRELMQTTIDAAWRSDFLRIELTVRQDNRNAVALYKRMGFAVEGVHWDAVRIDGRGFPLLSMALRRDPEN